MNEGTLDLDCSSDGDAIVDYRSSNEDVEAGNVTKAKQAKPTAMACQLV